MKDLGTRLAQYQFALALTIIVGFFVAITFVGLHKLDVAVVEKLSPFVMLPVMYFFQRQRHSNDLPVVLTPPAPPANVKIGDNS